MIKRCEKLAFMQTTGGDYTRMTGFTELSVSKNPKEYARKYIDEDAERSAVVSYAPSISYKLDLDMQNSVHQIFASIADSELVGDDTIKSIVIVDISSPAQDGSCPAIKRDFSIIPSNEGDDSDVYTLSGSLKASGEKVIGTAVSTDDWQTLTFSA